MFLSSYRMKSKQVTRSTRAQLVPALLMGVTLAGCGASLTDMADSSAVVGYKPASLFSPAGYSIENNPNGGIRVTAAGAPSTPATRLEKIALARAAEYGAEQHLKTFKSEPPQHGFKCGKSEVSDKGQIRKIKPFDLRTVQIDVTYPKDEDDPATRKTKETATP